MIPRSVQRPDISPAPAAAGTTPLALVTDDLDLVARIRAGDVDAYRAMFEAYYEPLCAFARAYVDSPPTAEELVQDVFAWVWVERMRWTVRDSLRNYLFGAVRNRALNVRRDGKRHESWTARVAAEPAPPGHGQGPPPVDETLRLGELGAAIERAVAALPERRRHAFTLRWQYHLSNAEIARAMGISVKGVEMALGHAFRTLRSQLSGFF